MGKRVVNGMLGLLAASLLTGCASSFQGGKLDRVKGFPPVASRKSVKVDLIFTGKLNGKPWTAMDKHNTVYLKQQCVQHMKDSKMFGLVSPGLKNPDLLLSVALINEKEESSGRQLLTALTLYIFPYKSTDTFRMLAIVRDPRTGASQRIMLEEEVSHWQQLLLIPLSPFKRPTGAIDNCTERLFDNLCLEIQKSGLL